MMEWALALAALAIALWVWTDGLRAKERALLHAQRACQATHVQLLDQTLALRRVGLIRRDLGGLALRRSYQFDFSAQGTDRRKGAVTLLGLVLEGVTLEDGTGRVVMADPHSRGEDDVPPP